MDGDCAQDGGVNSPGLRQVPLFLANRSAFRCRLHSIALSILPRSTTPLRLHLLPPPLTTAQCVSFSSYWDSPLASSTMHFPSKRLLPQHCLQPLTRPAVNLPARPKPEVPRDGPDAIGSSTQPGFKPEHTKPGQAGATESDLEGLVCTPSADMTTDLDFRQ